MTGYEFPCDVLDCGHEEPCGGGGDASLEVFGEAAVSPEPREGAFDYPAARQEDEALGGVAPLDDLERPHAYGRKGTS